MGAIGVIAAKQDGGVRSDAQIRWVMAAFIAGEQISAQLMAVLWRGLDPRKLSTRTTAMEMIAAQGGDPRSPSRLASRQSRRRARGSSPASTRSPWVPRPGGSVPDASARATRSYPAAGVLLAAALGDRVEAGSPLAVLHAATPARLKDGRYALRTAFDITDTAGDPVPPSWREWPDRAPADRRTHAHSRPWRQAD